MNIQDNQGSTPLHITSSSGDFDSVQLLFEQDAEVLAWDNEGSTQVLIRNGAAVNVRDNKKLTPLHSRISQGEPHRHQTVDSVWRGCGCPGQQGFESRASRTGQWKLQYC